MKYVLLLLLLGLLASCSSVPTYEAVSLEDEFDYHKGREVVFAQQDGISAWAIFEGQNENELNFWVKLRNDSKQKIVVNPKSLFLRFEDSEEKIFLAYDPEVKIDNLYMDQMNSESGHGIATGINILLGVANVASDLADEDYHEASHEIAFHADMQESINMDHDNEIMNLDNQLSYWQNETFRITTLYPGEEIDGFVHFPFERKELKFELVIDMREKDITFKYQLKEMF